ncbi:hypothetical protein IWW48_003819 [Coemansia sp. RSA 1200]|nr:hypothetical protein IWW48_003819 [Coemansia sp. RSA 1200]
MVKIPTVEIGVPGNMVSIPRIGLGTTSLSHLYGRTNDDASIELLNQAVDIGCTFIDTADIYGKGNDEKLLSHVLRKHRSRVFLCTKFGLKLYNSGKKESDGEDEFRIRVDNSPEYMRKCIKDSLNRLGTDYIDLYYIHRIDRDFAIEETVAAMAELVKEGKVRYLGLSNCSAEDLRRAHKIHPIAAVQREYSAWHTMVETDGLLDTCRELGVTFVAYTPLGRGFLTGRFQSNDDIPEGDMRQNMPRFNSENIGHNLKLVEALDTLAKKHSCKPGQIALAWLLAQYDNLVAIPGTKTPKYLEENFAAGKITLPTQDIEELRRIIDNVDLHGANW